MERTKGRQGKTQREQKGEKGLWKPQKDSSRHTCSSSKGKTSLCHHTYARSPPSNQSFSKCTSAATRHGYIRLRCLPPPRLIGKRCPFPCRAVQNTLRTSMYPCTHASLATRPCTQWPGPPNRERHPPLLEPVQPPSSHYHHSYTQAKTQTSTPQKQGAPQPRQAWPWTPQILRTWSRGTTRRVNVGFWIRGGQGATGFVPHVLPP